MDADNGNRKLVMAHPPTKDPPTILAISDFTPKPPAFEAVTSSSPEFQVHLETFLSYLVFWQDVLEHCRSAEVKQTLLAHFQVLFLQQLLWVYDIWFGWWPADEETDTLRYWSRLISMVGPLLRSLRMFALCWIRWIMPR